MKLPPGKYLHECFYIDKGWSKTGLVWKRRPRRHFKSKWAYTVWNRCNRERRAGTKVPNYNIYKVGIDGKIYPCHLIVEAMLEHQRKEEEYRRILAA
jgi:hypothetical protein